NFKLNLYFLFVSSKYKTSKLKKLAKYFCRLLFVTFVSLDNSVKVRPSGNFLIVSKIEKVLSTDCIPFVFIPLRSIHFTPSLKNVLITKLYFIICKFYNYSK